MKKSTQRATEFSTKKGCHPHLHCPNVHLGFVKTVQMKEPQTKKDKMLLGTAYASYLCMKHFIKECENFEIK